MTPLPRGSGVFFSDSYFSSQSAGFAGACSLPERDCARAPRAACLAEWTCAFFAGGPNVEGRLGTPQLVGASPRIPRCRSSTALPTCTATSPPGGATSMPIPNCMYDVHRTAASVAEKLKAFGCDEVVTGHRPHRRGRRDPRREGRGGRDQGDRAARRHGRAADRGGERRSLQVDRARQDARLRP